MRKVYTAFVLLITMLFGAMAIGQEQQKSYINYQGVARKADGALMNNESLSIGVKLKFGSSSSEIAYEESHSLTTDANGVFSLLIGNGSTVDGDYINLPWGDFATYATVSINGSEIGTTELMAVPHALSSADNQWHTMGNDIENKNGGNVFVTGSLYASKDFSLAEGTAVNEFSTDITLGGNSDEIVPTQKAVKTYVDGQLGGSGGGADDQTAAEVAYDNSTSGLTANTAQAAIDELVTGGSVDADSDPNNEIQTLSFNVATSELSLTDGGSVTLLSGAADADADPNNEIQDISLSGTELTISDGSTIDLAPIVPPGGTDDQNAAEVPFDNTGTGLAASDTQAAIEELASGGLVDTDDQDLILSGDVLTIEDGAGSVDLSVYKDEDVTTKTGILLGDGTAISGLVGTADGQVAKWNAGTSTWEAGADEVGGGGSGTPTGLEALDEGNGIGWRLIGRDPNDYGNIGENAIDLSYFNELLPNGGATGNYALATGDNTRAIGDWSTSMGRQNSAEGEVSFATGFQNIASGSYSTVMGRETQATGSRSVAMNSETSATGDAATSMGFSTRANGRASVSMGVETKADAQSTLAIGRFNVGGGHPTNWVGSDPVFEIGNGDGPGVMRANAFTVLKSGWVGIGTPTPTTKLEVMGTIRSSHLAGAGERNVVADANGDLIIGAGGSGGSLWSENGSNIYFDSGKVGIGTSSPDANLEVVGTGSTTQRMTSTGGLVSLQWLRQGNANTDWMLNALPGAMEWHYSSTDLSGLSPLHTRLLDDGTFEVVKGIRSGNLAGVGERNIVADANGNLIIGAVGGGSSPWTENGSDIYYDGGNVGIGVDNPGSALDVKSDIRLAARFRSTVSQNYLTFSNNNGYKGYLGIWTGANDMDFGTGASNNAGKTHLTTKATPRLTATANGNIGIGTTSPTTKMHITSNSSVDKPQVRLEEQGNDYARLELTNNTSNAVWHVAGIANNNPSNSFLNFFYKNDEGGSNRMTITGAGNVLVDGSLVHSSDRRLKRDIETLPYGLKEILRLEPKIYNWIDNRSEGSKSLGLIAQDVERIIPEIVHKKTDSIKTLSLSYTELVPVLIKAVQELKEENDSLKSQLKLLAANVESMNSDFSELKNQIETLNEHKKAVDIAAEK